MGRLLMTLLMAVFLSFPLSSMSRAADTGCKEFIETRSAKQLSKELGKPKKWVVANYRIKLLDRETGKGKGKVVGNLLPGSRAEILKVGPDHYQVKSPLDGSVGWISRAQVRHTLLLDSKTLQPCR